MKKLIILLLVVIALGSAAYIYFFIINKEHPDYKDLPADFNVTAGEFYNEFTSDAASASVKYNGKMVQLSGECNRIEVVDTLVIAVFAMNEGMFGDEGIRCTFLKSSAANIREPKDLAGSEIKGFCSGYNDVDVILEKCSLVKSK